MSSNTYISGTAIQITLTFTDVDGAACDPDTVKAYVKTPAGVVGEYVFGVDGELTQSAVGIYKLLYALAINAPVGFYAYGGRGIGTYNVTADNGQFYVRDWPFD